jgi:hypothetical protein
MSVFALRARRIRRRGVVLLASVACVAGCLVGPSRVLADDNTVPPNPPFAVSPQSGAGNQYSAPYQWWRIALNKGDSVSATLTVTSEAGDDVYLRLYPPGTTDGRQSHVASEEGPGKSFTYVADRSGEFLFRVFTFDSGNSSYVFTFEVTRAPVKSALGLLSTPTAPRTMSRTVYYNVYGYLKPRHTKGTYPVRIYRWRLTPAKTWKAYGFVRAKAYDYSSYTKYVARIRLSERGTWRLRAYAPEDARHAAKWSGVRTVIVK